MRAKLLLAGLLLAVSLSLFACDVCGGGGSGNFQGVVPLFGQNQFSFRTNFFTATHGNALFNGTSQVLKDQFFQQEFTFRKFSPNKMIYSFSLPTGMNSRIETERTTRITGIGDAQIGAARIFVNTSDSSFRSVKHILTLGVGMALPTGKYMQRDETLLRLPAYFQLGRGAYAYSFNLYYVIRRKNLGLALTGQERVFSKNELSYQFGKSSVLSAVAFYRWNIPTLGATVLPQMGFAFEQQGQDTSYGIVETSTGGKQSWGNFALDVYRGRWAYGINLQRKISSNLPSGQAESQLRCGIQVTYRLAKK